MALAYAAFLGGIWIETEMKIPLIIEGYGDFESIELTAHSFKYLFWFSVFFSIAFIIFFFTNACEKMKRVFAVAIPLLITADIASAWLIRYQDLFAYTLFASGLLLALIFLSMFCRIQRDIWIPDKKADG